MNKTVTANISGIVFHIESQAYEQLHQYLTTIRNYFHDSDGKDEIMADIESRIAELFRESLQNGREVITKAEVQRVVEIMGEPEQYMDEDHESYKHSTSQEESGNRQKIKSKKLFRDPDDKVLGGVCSGLGHYFGIDRIWLRALFLIAIVAGFGAGFIIYVILWAIIPKAISTSEKLEMKGEPINVENIGNTIKDEFNSFKKKVGNDEMNSMGDKAGNALYKFFDFAGKILLGFFKFLIKFFAVILVIMSVTFLIGFISFLVGGPINVNLDHGTFEGIWTPEFIEIFFTSGGMFSLGLLGASLVLLIPILGLLYGGIRILFNLKGSNRTVGITGTFTLGIGLYSFIYCRY